MDIVDLKSNISEIRNIIGLAEAYAQKTRGLQTRKI